MQSRIHNEGTASTETSLSHYVDRLIEKAVLDHASDIHFEPFENRFRIRYRVDGVLNEIPSHVDHLGDAIISRIKVMSQLDIAENRVPQDGRIQVHLGGRNVDIRVSTLPTQFGESIVLRLLDQSNTQLKLDELGMSASMVQSVRFAIHQPNGIFLTTGPTGSGKTTTLYSAISELNCPENKLLTVEDPVEYAMKGVVQVQTNSAIGMDFPRALRSFLRHDPDKILIGEIRDVDTAQIAVQASLTGHMVFSSLHTNDAVGAVTRLVDLGVEPYLISASLTAVLAQRLVRRLNPDICESYVPDSFELEQLGCVDLPRESRFYRPQLGVDSSIDVFSGRVGIFEMLSISDEFRDAIVAVESHRGLTRIAMNQGMQTLRQDGLRALRAGLTSVEQILSQS